MKGDERMIKTIDVNAKEWFDKVNGNSYFAGIVTIDYGTADEFSFMMPFEYGYGSYFEQEALNQLKKRGYVPTCVNTLYQVKDLGIILRSSIQRGCKRRELKEMEIPNAGKLY